VGSWGFRAEVDENVVRVSGELDLVSSPCLEACFALVGLGCDVVVDVSALTFIDARGLDTLLAAAYDVMADGHRFEIHGATGIVKRLLEVVGRKDLMAASPGLLAAG